MSKNIKIALNFLLDLSTEGMWGELRSKHKTLDSILTLHGKSVPIFVVFV